MSSITQHIFNPLRRPALADYRATEGGSVDEGRPDTANTEDETGEQEHIFTGIFVTNSLKVVEPEQGNGQSDGLLELAKNLCRPKTAR